MFLVPQQQLLSLQQQQTTNGSLRQSAQNELDQAMGEILKQSDVDVYEKAKRYSSILQRYLAMVKQGEQEKGVITLSLPEENSKEDPRDNDAEDDIISEVLKHMPKRNKRNAEFIMASLARNNEQLSWTKQGEIIVNNKSVPGSHLYDLVKSVTSYHNSAGQSRPTGWNLFLKTLANLNVPLSVIPNTAVRRSIAAFKTVTSPGDISPLRTPTSNRNRPVGDSNIGLIPSILRYSSPPTTSRWASF